MALAKNSIFISYRKDDSGGWASQFANHLREAFGKDAVFIDDSSGIPLGTQWPEQITMALQQCRVFLPVIAPSWTKEPNLGRLKSKKDWVRHELLTAHHRKTWVLSIPVFVNEAAVLNPSLFLDDTELHQAITVLMNDQGLNLERSPEHWPSKVEHLVSRINNHLGTEAPRQVDGKDVSSNMSENDPEIGVNAWLNSRQGMLAFLALALTGSGLIFQLTKLNNTVVIDEPFTENNVHENSTSEVDHSSVSDRIAKGEKFKVYLNGPHCPSDDNENWEDGDPLGTLICGEIYIVRYIVEDDEWNVSGYHESNNEYRKNVRNSALDFDPNLSMLKLFGAPFAFNEGHEVIDRTIGRVGTLVFYSKL